MLAKAHSFLQNQTPRIRTGMNLEEGLGYAHLDLLITLLPLNAWVKSLFPMFLKI